MRIALATAVALAAGVAVVPVAAAPSVVVTATGRVGAFQVDRTTEATIRRVAGPPDRVQLFETAGGGPIGKSLLYRCGRGCTTWYYVNRKTHLLANFSGNSPRLVTPNGTRIGMTKAEAERRERARTQNGCLIGIVLHTRVATLDLGIERGRVSEFRLAGRHSVVDC